MVIPIEKCNPYVRAAEFQHAVLEGEGHRLAYDMRLFAVLEGNGTLVIDKQECTEISRNPYSDPIMIRSLTAIAKG